MENEKTVLVMLGLGKDQKPRAATFTMDEAQAAAKAADLMGLKLARAESDEALAFAKMLPEGKIYASGKGLMPLIRRDIYNKLLAAVTLIDHKPPSDADPAATKPGDNLFPPDPWNGIEIGAVVLWRADPSEGWFEAVVTGTRICGYDQLPYIKKSAPGNPQSC